MPKFLPIARRGRRVRLGRARAMRGTAFVLCGDWHRADDQGALKVSRERQWGWKGSTITRR